MLGYKNIMYIIIISKSKYFVYRFVLKSYLLYNI